MRTRVPAFISAFILYVSLAYITFIVHQCRGSGFAMIRIFFPNLQRPSGKMDPDPTCCTLDYIEIYFILEFLADTNTEVQKYDASTNNSNVLTYWRDMAELRP
jgi:hypothetical protein